MLEMRATVFGKVQGVRYRDYVQISATEYGLKGFVKNQDDGNVLVVAQGDSESLKNLVECLHEGSVLSQVTTVAVEWGSPRVTYNDFSVLH